MTILSLIGGFLGRVSARVWLVVAIVIAVLLMMLGARRAGRLAERAEQQLQALKVKDAQLRAAANRPRNRDELARRLRERRF
ncbi:MAG TPA: hypothetical protein VF274_09585 [Alphaproteobacteria bacterium]